MVKYCANLFHALKICFANEIDAICRHFNLDSHQVMDIVVQDKKLNLSAAYMKPGFAFGGSRLPKDVRAVTRFSRSLELYLINALLPSNRRQIDLALVHIMGTGKKCMGLLGLSFKHGTDDLRESPLLELASRLLAMGCQLKCYDANISPQKLIGANKEYVQQKVGSLDQLLFVSSDEILGFADVIIIGHNSPSYADLLAHLRPQQQVIDLVRIQNPPLALENYYGLSW